MRESFRSRSAVAYLVITLVLLATVNSSAEPELERIRRERVQERAQMFVAEGKRELERQNYIRATRVLSDAIRLGGVPEALKLRGEAQAGKGETEAALRDFDNYLNTNPSDAEAHVLRGDVHLALSDFPKAVQDYDAAIRLDRTLVDAFRGRGAAYIGCGEYESAQKDLGSVLARSPYDVEALTNMGIACRLAGMPSAAEHFFTRALSCETVEPWREVILSQLAGLAHHPAASLHVAGPSAFLSWECEQKEQAPRTPAQLPRACSPVCPLETSLPKNTTQRSGAHMPPTTESAGRRRSRVASRSSPDLSGRWDTTYMGSSIQLVVKHNGMRIAGTLTIHNPTGKEDTYHFQGTFDGAHIVATHHSGHSFRGTLTPEGRLVGTLTTKYGKTFNVDFSR